MTIGPGIKTFTVATGLPTSLYFPGKLIMVLNGSGTGTVSMTGNITSYNSGTGSLTASFWTTAGSGTLASWTVTPFTEANNTINANHSWEVTNPPDTYRTMQININPSSTSFDIEFANTGPTGSQTGFVFKVDEVYVTGWPQSQCTPPAAPTGSASQPFCSSANNTVADLTATGNTIKWYAASSGGTALDPSTVLVNNTRYYASQTVGCESTSRLDVIVTVNPALLPPSIQHKLN
jgi:hypothetical protein